MGISQYLKEIGRGKQGARPLDRAQAADLFGQVLDGSAGDLEVGAFCIAMRIKGETTEEMAGFLDATAARLRRVPVAATAVVLPSYNGARRLPVLTPLLALLLAREGVPVVMHGTATEEGRVGVPQVLEALGRPALTALRPVAAGETVFVPTELLCPGLKRLLDVRRAVGLRNSAHSLVKLMNPCDRAAVVVGSYTHPEYAVSMGEVFERMGSTALLIRGTEGEAVADARRLPQMTGFVRGARVVLEEGQKGTVPATAVLPQGTDPATTAAFIGEVLDGTRPVPASLALQVEHILRLVRQA
ncbi:MULTISPECIES: DNA-binding protein YbiB [Ramlibacter]|uniref:DNA-binding protein YbiB n=1 Tax=Ramlibacter aquaticus TaxID=2780094 RepID=A0ABR9S9G0_9BURK|nr:MULTISPECIES: DNA-binding protein YbiB [Ramlibacter]MBE7938958.1 DNA-binding protein YbiB [Ramlibacter aquaticus]